MAESTDKPESNPSEEPKPKTTRESSLLKISKGKARFDTPHVPKQVYILPGTEHCATCSGRRYVGHSFCKTCKGSGLTSK